MLCTRDFELDHFLNGVLAHYRKLAHQKNIELSIIDDMASRVLISGNPDKLKILLDMVIQNTIQRTGASRICFSTRQLLRTEKEILLEFLLEDNGPHEKGNHKYPYLRSIISARNLIEEMGGKSEWTFSQGHGTILKFIIKYKWSDVADLKCGKLISSCTMVLKSKKVLVVEDNEINQRTILEILQKENIGSVVASNGKEAIDILEKNPQIDLVLLDQQLPYMDGFETANYIRRILKNKLPIIGLIPGGPDDVKKKCLESGMNRFIKKPFTGPELLEQMCSFYERLPLSKESKALMHAPTKEG